MPPLVLHEDRYFDSDPAIRAVARDLYEQARDLPIVGPHGHVDPKLLAENEPFPEPASLIIIPDHYVFRMLYSQGIPLEALGIPTVDGTPVETDPRKIWQLFADHFYLFAGTPTGAWLNHELYHVFGVRHRLDGASAQYVYDQINEQLSLPEFRPRALYERFNIEVLTTTDAATDTLDYHVETIDSDWEGTVLPCFRPDTLFRIAAPDWRQNVDLLGERIRDEVTDYTDFVEAVEYRRAFFKFIGAVATDYAVAHLHTHRLSDKEAGALFQKALRGKATPMDEAAFQSHMLMEMARMSVEDGLVMQIHPGSDRNHNEQIYRRFGPDKGADIPLATEYTRNLHALLNAYGNDPNFTLVVFTLDESAYARELAPLAGHYPAMKLGPAWWFFDSIEGMRRYRELTTETAGFWNTAGFNDDTRAFCSIPARHDLARRVDANYLAGLAARHVLDVSDARVIMRALTYDLVRKTYKLDKLQEERWASAYPEEAAALEWEQWKATHPHEEEDRFGPDD